MSSLNGLLFTQSLLSTAHGFWVTSSLLTAIPFLYDLNVFSDANLQPDDPGVYSIVELCIAAGSFLISLVGSFTVLASKSRKSNSLSQFTLGAFYVISFVVSMVILGLRMNNMGILANWGLADAANTCVDDSFTGNPIARLELSGRKVEVITDCQFNVYDAQLQNVNQFGSGTNDPILVDWSRSFNYDAANSGVLAAAAQSAGLNVDAAAMPLLHSYWYWGCNSVCHPRYKLNQTWLGYTILNVGVYLVLLIVSFAAAVEVQKIENLGGEKKDEEKGLVSQTSPDAEDDDEGDEDEFRSHSFSSIRF